LAPANFFLFPQLKAALKGQHFCDDTDITKNVTQVLIRLSQNGFQKSFKQLSNSYTVAGRNT